jgi:hypothetical protein
MFNDGDGMRERETESEKKMREIQRDIKDFKCNISTSD